MTQRDMCVPADNPLAAFVTNALPQVGMTGSPNFPPITTGDMGVTGSPVIKDSMKMDGSKNSLEGFDGDNISILRKNGVLKEDGENIKEHKENGASPSLLSNVSTPI